MIADFTEVRRRLRPSVPAAAHPIGRPKPYLPWWDSQESELTTEHRGAAKNNFFFWTAARHSLLIPAELCWFTRNIDLAPAFRILCVSRRIRIRREIIYSDNSRSKSFLMRSGAISRARHLWCFRSWLGFACFAAEKQRIQVNDYIIQAVISPQTHQLKAQARVKFTALDDITIAIFELHNALRPTA